MVTVFALGTLALGTFLWAPAALSDPLMAMAVPAERAADVVRTMHMASASHTATSHHARVRHRHRHHAPRVSLAANRTPAHGSDAPLPAPDRRRPDPGARPPSIGFGAPHAHAFKTGTRRATTPTASGIMLPVATRVLESRQNQAPDAREHPVTSGRGPPRGSPTRSHGTARLVSPASESPLDSPRSTRFRPTPSSTEPVAPPVAARPVPARPGGEPDRSPWFPEAGPWPPPRRSPRGRDGALFHALEWR